LFASQNVDDFVAARAYGFNKVQQGQVPSHKRFNINQLRSTKFHRFQQGVEPGWGPGGRRLKPSLPDQYFQTDKRNFWFSVYTAVDDFVTIRSSSSLQSSSITNLIRKQLCPLGPKR